MIHVHHTQDYYTHYIIISMYNVHPYFSLKNLGKKVHYTQQNTVIAAGKGNVI